MGIDIIDPTDQVDLRELDPIFLSPRVAYRGSNGVFIDQFEGNLPSIDLSRPAI
jgi:hypothetical protein